MWHSRPPRDPPPLHGKNHVIFPFWLFDTLPNGARLSSTSSFFTISNVIFTACSHASNFFSVGGVVLQSYIATHSTAARAVAFLGKTYFLCISKIFILLHFVQAHGYLTSIQKMGPCEFLILSFLFLVMQFFPKQKISPCWYLNFCHIVCPYFQRE